MEKKRGLVMSDMNIENMTPQELLNIAKTVQEKQLSTLAEEARKKINIKIHDAIQYGKSATVYNLSESEKPLIKELKQHFKKFNCIHHSYVANNPREHLDYDRDYLKFSW